MVATYLADPGGVFESDTHRRVLAHLHDDAQQPDALFVRIFPDINTPVEDSDELMEVLADLEAEGYASKSKEGWKLTKRGLDALTGPNAGEEE